MRTRALAVLATALASAATLSAINPYSTWPGPLVWHGPREKNRVALTFDDGPNNVYTPRVAEILDAYGVKATFFAVGRAVDGAPAVVEDLLNGGHLLANHSYSHRRRDSLPLRYDEIDKTDDAFQHHFGLSPAFYRPPHGTHTIGIARAVARHDMTMVTWDVMASDWKERDPDIVARRILAGTKPGSIILLHDGSDGDLTGDRAVVVDALPTILEGLNRRGLEPVSLDSLLGKPAYLSN